MKKVSPNWYGMLTIANIEEITKVIRQILEGKRYTFVAINMYDVDDGQLVYRPEVRTGQQMNAGDAITIWYSDDRKYVGFNVGDTYGVWGTATALDDDRYDPKFNNPYIVFEHGHTIRITHQAPAGHLLYWIIAVEPEQDESEVDNG